MFTNDNENQEELNKFTFKKAYETLTKKEEKMIKQNIAIINNTPSSPNNFAPVIKKALNQLKKDGKKTTQAKFFENYGAKYEPNDTNASITSTYTSYMSNKKRPSPIRMVQLLDYIFKLIFDVPKNDFERTIYMLQPEHQEKMRQYSYITTIFKDSKEANKYVKLIVNDAFLSTKLLINSLNKILNIKISSWDEIDRWAKTYTALNKIAFRKIKLIESFAYLEKQLMDYHYWHLIPNRDGTRYHLSELLDKALIKPSRPSNPSKDEKYDPAYPMFIGMFKKEQENYTWAKQTLSNLGIDNIYDVLEITYPNFKLKDTIEATYPHVREFFESLKHSDSAIENLNILDDKIQSEYEERKYSDIHYPQFNERNFIYLSAIDILLDLIDNFSDDHKPQFYF